jgi:phage terminase large subunit-like protein
MAAANCPVEEYAREVLAGHIPAGELIKKACERHLADLQNGSERGLYFDWEAANHAIYFFQFLKHSKGEWAGRTIYLEPWQMFIVGSIFGWKREDGRRRYRTAYIEVPRKNGKSTLVSGIALYLLIADGEGGAEIYMAATKRDQAKIAFDEAARMVKKSPHLKKRVNILKNNLNVETTASKFEPLGADADSMDGLNVHGAFIDELHAHKTRAVWDVLETATGSRIQPLQLAITTAGFNRESICYEQHEYSEKILNNVIDDDTYFSYIACIDEGDDWRNPETWAKTNPNFGISVKEDDLQRKCNKAKEMPAAQNNFLCKHLNKWTNQSERWMDIDKWKASAGELPDLEGEQCYVGMDLSSKTDLTAIVLDFPMDDGSHAVIPHFFIPEDTMQEKMRKEKVPYDMWEREGFLTATPGNVIDYEFVKHYLRKMADKYEIVEVGFDPWNASQISVDLDNDGFTMVEIRQGYRSLSEPTKTLMALVLSKRLIHGDHPVLTWCADNMVVRTDPSGNVKPDKEQATQKIDGMVALIMALSRSIVHQDTTSVYEGRGMLSL